MKEYLVVNCGYTPRLNRHVKEMKYKPLFIAGGLEPVLHECDISEFKNLVSLFNKSNGFIPEDIKYGAIVFKYTEGFNGMEVIRQLCEFNHCGYFFLDDYYFEDEDEEKVKKRLMMDEDLDNFVKGNSEYYHGTLYEVKILVKDDVKIKFLRFDTESG